MSSVTKPLVLRQRAPRTDLTGKTKDEKTKHKIKQNRERRKRIRDIETDAMEQVSRYFHEKVVNRVVREAREVIDQADASATNIGFTELRTAKVSKEYVKRVESTSTAMQKGLERKEVISVVKRRRVQPAEESFTDNVQKRLEQTSITDKEQDPTEFDALPDDPLVTAAQVNDESEKLEATIESDDENAVRASSDAV